MFVNPNRKHYGQLFETSDIEKVNAALKDGATISLVFERDGKAVYIVQEYKPLQHQKADRTD